ncbi:MAG TPA: galactokinase family protein [Blastocatellia bacterium]|nr:galactokinase family protein [Blastocatellia bacterium]
MNTTKDRKQRARQLEDRFRRLYGDGPVTLLRAPARINVLGEHVDYVSYLPTASLVFGSGEHEMLMAFRAASDGRVRGASTDNAFEPFTFAPGEAPAPGSDWNRWLYERPAPAPDWGNYVKGAVFFAALKEGARISNGFDFLVDSTIPPKGGASSSSALVVLSGAAIRLVNQVEFDPRTLARESSQAEWYVGTRGGAMDHTAICLSKQHHAVHLSYREDKAELVPLPDDRFRWVTFFSHEADKGRGVMLEYNERAAVARLLIPAIIGESSKTFSDLQAAINKLPAAITLDEVGQLYPKTFSECRQAFPALVQERRAVPLKLRDRALHHVGEVRRVAVAVEMLRETANEAVSPVASEALMRRIGELLDESNSSLRDLYEVSTPEVNRLIEIIRSDPQVYGARLMGGGFGGNVLALTTADNVRKLIGLVQSEFYGPRGRDGLREGAVMVSTPGDGLSIINP